MNSFLGDYVFALVIIALSILHIHLCLSIDFVCKHTASRIYFQSDHSFNLLPLNDNQQLHQEYLNSSRLHYRTIHSTADDNMVLQEHENIMFCVVEESPTGAV